MFYQKLKSKKPFDFEVTIFVSTLIVIFITFGLSCNQKSSKKSDITNSNFTVKTFSTADSKSERSTRNSASFEDSEIKKLQNEDIQLASRQVEAMAVVPVLKWQNELVANMSSEDINQAIQNLANFDGPIEMFLFSSGYPSARAYAQNRCVTQLIRVKKLYAIGKENPKLVIPILRKVQNESLAQWPVIYHGSEASIRCSDKCLAATYLLAEFVDYDSLPVLSQQYKLLNSPVAPATTFYAMHRLASIYPRDKLSAEAVKTLDEYLNASKELVPPPEQIEVIVKDEILKSQKTMTMPLYPDKFKFKDRWRIQDAYGEVNTNELMRLYKKITASEKSELNKMMEDSQMQNGYDGKSKTMDELFNKLDAFVQIVYPAQRNSSQ